MKAHDTQTKDLDLTNSKYNKFKERQRAFKVKAEKMSEENKALRDEKKLRTREKRALEDGRNELEEQVDGLLKENDHYKSIAGQKNEVARARLSQINAGTSVNTHVDADTENKSNAKSQMPTENFQVQLDALQLEKNKVKAQFEKLAEELKLAKLERDKAVRDQSEEKARKDEELELKEARIRGYEAGKSQAKDEARE